MVTNLEGAVYCLPADVNGYAGPHNSRYSRPVAGYFDSDLARSRDKRIFDDPTGRRSATNTSAFLLQTYARDIGRMMSDLASPIYVDGNRWGR